MKKYKILFLLLMTFIIAVALPTVALAESGGTETALGTNWTEVAAVAEAVVVLLFGFLVSYFKTSSVFRGFVAQLITDAEVKYAKAEKAGEQKMSWVIDKLYAIIPLPFRIVFTKERIQTFVQDVFDQITQYATIQCDKAVAKLQEKYNSTKK